MMHHGRSRTGRRAMGAALTGGLIVVGGLLFVACGSDDEAVETVDETPTEALTETVAPSGPTEVATEAPPTSVAGAPATEVPATEAPATEPPTEAPTEAPTPPPVAEGPILAVGSGDQLAGVAVQTPAEDAVAALITVFGQPTGDSGWVIGCPLDSADNLNERTVSWGSLDALFYLEEGGERFVGWRYRIDPGSGGGLPGGPAVAQVQLPGGALLGATIDDVATAMGVAAVDDALTGARIIQGAGFVIVADGGPGTAATSVHVPVLRACE